MTNYRKVVSIFLSLVLTLFRLFSFTVNAEELVISGNGTGSTGDISVQSNSTTTITQNNNADVNNNVDTSADTGGNNASYNNGNANIDTGNVDSSTQVTNNLNSSEIGNDCCPQNSGINVDIKNNGEGSTNGVHLSSSRGNSVNVSQEADIDNHVLGSANTGRNNASDNNGNVGIDTGNIHVDSRIKNGPVNIYQVSSGNSDPGINVNISANASDSNNLVTALLSDLANINVNNNAQLKNHLMWDLNTGENDANGNNGNVSIKTGNIFADLFVENGPINSGKVDVSCCNNQNPPPPGGENPPPVNPPSNPGPNNPPTTISEILGVGGPGPAVLGLSFTGGIFDNPLLFWTGLFMLTMGIALLGRSLASVDPSRNET